MKNIHFKSCQPNSPKDETGFLKIGQLPEINAEQVQMQLRIIGAKMQLPLRNPALKIAQDPLETVTSSDADSDVSKSPERTEKCDTISSASFGDKSNRSNRKAKPETKTDTASERTSKTASDQIPSSKSPGRPPTQVEVDDFFETVKSKSKA